MKSVEGVPMVSVVAVTGWGTWSPCRCPWSSWGTWSPAGPVELAMLQVEGVHLVELMRLIALPPVAVAGRGM